MISIKGYENLYIVSGLEIFGFVLIGIILTLFLFSVGYFLNKIYQAKLDYKKSLTDKEFRKYQKFQDSI